jgi:hypothetical protein
MKAEISIKLVLFESALVERLLFELYTNLVAKVQFAALTLAS